MSENPDGDPFDNLAEFTFGLSAGTPDPGLGRDWSGPGGGRLGILWSLNPAAEGYVEIAPTQLYFLTGGCAPAVVRNRFLTLLAIPPGLFVGWALSKWILMSFDSEVYRIPLVITAPNIAWSLLTVLAASLISALVVRRKLDKLDLVAVLKTRE